MASASNAGPTGGVVASIPRGRAAKSRAPKRGTGSRIAKATKPKSGDTGKGGSGGDNHGCGGGPCMEDEVDMTSFDTV